MNSRLTAEHATRLHLFRHTAQKSLSIRQYARGLFGHSDEKSVCAICALELIIVYLDYTHHHMRKLSNDGKSKRESYNFIISDAKYKSIW